jgi:hypothetical protein
MLDQSLESLMELRKTNAQKRQELRRKVMEEGKGKTLVRKAVKTWVRKRVLFWFL